MITSQLWSTIPFNRQLIYKYVNFCEKDSLVYPVSGQKVLWSTLNTIYGNATKLSTTWKIAVPSLYIT